MPKSTKYIPPLGSTKDVFKLSNPNYWKKADALTKNKFVMYLNVGQTMPGDSNSFEYLCIPIQSVSNQTFDTQTFERGDGVTGIKFNYSSGMRDFGSVTITAVRDPYDPYDMMLQEAVLKFILNGTKSYGRIVKFHHAGHSPFEIVFEGLSFKERSISEFTVSEGGMLEETYTCDVDFWYEIPAESYDDTKGIAKPIKLVR